MLPLVSAPAAPAAKRTTLIRAFAVLADALEMEPKALAMPNLAASHALVIKAMALTA